MKESAEEWRPVVGYEDFYEVSDCGRVRSLDRWVNTKGGAKRMIKGRILREWLRGRYLCVALLHHNFYSVHRLVAEAFLPNPDNLPQLNHKDENPSNNVASNLEWCTQAYNNTYGTRIERMSKTRKNDPRFSKKVCQYTLNGELVKTFPSIEECGRQGFSTSSVSFCCKGRKNYKTHKGFIWRYEGESLA